MVEEEYIHLILNTELEVLHLEVYLCTEHRNIMYLKTFNRSKCSKLHKMEIFRYLQLVLKASVYNYWKSCNSRLHCNKCK